MYLCGGSKPPPYLRTKIPSTAKIKDISSFAFSFAYAGAKEKAIKKKSAGREMSRSAERDKGSAR